MTDYFEDTQPRVSHTRWVKIVGLAVLALVLLSVGMCSMETVEAGNRGVLVSNGKVTGQVGEGLHLVNPFTTVIVPINVRQQKWSQTTEAYTFDVQQAEVSFTLSYALQPGKARWAYQTQGEDWSGNLIPQVVYESIKNVFGKSRAVQDTINNRGVVQQRILAEIRRKLAARNIIVHGFELTNISFSDAFESAVEAKQVAVEIANAERNKTVAVQERANQTLITAKANAEAMRIKSAALSSNPGLTAYEYAIRWNGVMPSTMVGSNTPLFLQSGR